MHRNILLSIVARAYRGVTHDEHGRGWSCITIGKDQERFIVEASSWIQEFPTVEGSRVTRALDWWKVVKEIFAERRVAPVRLDEAEALG